MSEKPFEKGNFKKIIERDLAKLNKTTDELSTAIGTCDISIVPKVAEALEEAGNIAIFIRTALVLDDISPEESSHFSEKEYNARVRLIQTAQNFAWKCKCEVK